MFMRMTVLTLSAIIASAANIAIRYTERMFEFHLWELFSLSGNIEDPYWELYDIHSTTQIVY